MAKPCLAKNILVRLNGFKRNSNFSIMDLYTEALHVRMFEVCLTKLGFLSLHDVTRNSHRNCATRSVLTTFPLRAGTHCLPLVVSDISARFNSVCETLDRAS